MKPMSECKCGYDEVELGYASPCWLWRGWVSPDGYGRKCADGFRLAHRWYYTKHVGPIPAGLEVDHLCYQHSCVNPAHLEPVTHAENQRRRFARQTHCRNGHEFTPDNLVLSLLHRQRKCLICSHAAEARYRQRRREARVTA